MSDPEMEFFTQRPGNCLYLALINGKVVGTAGAHVEDQGTTMNLTRMIVDPHYRGLGIAKKLMEVIKKHTRYG